eukprot:m.29498 g.29498  ORF g.29498 m.29498 type:complete len:484 (-) comp16102_c0_seq1:175-1626(-)
MAKRRREPSTKQAKKVEEPEAAASSKRAAEPVQDEIRPVKRSRVEDNDGVLMCLGQNCMGQLGFGLAVSERKKPGSVKKALEGVKCNQVVVGGIHTVAITSDGKVYTFGCNDEFALGRTCVATDVLEADEVEATPGLAEGLDGVNVVSASAGDSHTFVLADDGKVYGTGCFRDTSGALAFSDSSMLSKQFVQVYPPLEPETGIVYPPAVAISSGCDHVVLLAKGAANKSHVFTYGTGEQGQLGRLSSSKCSRDSKHRGVAGPKRDADFLDQVVKKKTSLAVLSCLLKFHPVDDKLWKRKNLVGVSASGWSTFVVDDAGKVFSWGLNNYAQLGLGPIKKKKIMTEFTPKAAKAFTSPVAQIDGGQHHCVVLTVDGEVQCIGRGETGQLGVVTDGKPVSETSEPVTVSGLGDDKIARVAAGSFCSFAISETGKAYAWGFGENLQLSTGIEEDAPTPVLISGSQVDERKIKWVDAGSQHTALIAAD